MPSNAQPSPARSLPLAPWALRLVTDRLPRTCPTPANTTLDPATQLALHTGTDGTVIELAKHGTNRTRGTATMSGGGDGSVPQHQSQDDNTTDYDND
ncbi:putative ATP-grasp-modified RiPP [Nocardiopsis valliformis]|uniref:putative ATP-grasp-modified RiPP n=1 Tax=Nocardiopsis valliformis TaxID=239974 RepID=UPI0006852F21|nr:putative ATP-grasp-modified RiPP [Nocardiopsis valliformis]